MSADRSQGPSTDRSQGASPDSNSGRLSVRLSPRLLSRLGAAVENGPYHSRSHLVRSALQLLLAPADEGRPRGSPTDPGASRPDGVRVGTIREVLPAREQPPRLVVELVDDRNASRATHAFIYNIGREGDVDRESDENRTATLRTYEPPPGLTHDQSASLGALRWTADEALRARGWRVRRSFGRK